MRGGGGDGGGGMASIRRSLLSPAAADHRHHHHQSQQRYRLPDHFPATARDRTHRFKWAHRPIPSNRSLLFFLLLGFFLGLLLLLTLDAGDPAALPPPPPPPPPLLSAATATPLKLLLVVTPTYPRALQAYYLTRLAHTLRLVPPPLLWIVVEMGSPDLHTARLLRTAGVAYRHLLSSNRTAGSLKDRGVHQRNAALRHIELHRLDGIVYFADDDNIYSLELFQRIREIRRFGTWPVAMLAESKNKATLEGPVCNGSQVVGWHTNEKSKRLRRFHVDMSGFAFNSTILWDPKRWRRPTSQKIRQLDTVKEGFQETTFIEQLVEDESQMEGIPLGCSRIMNWHLHLEAKDLVYPRGWQLSSNLDISVPLQ